MAIRKGQISSGGSTIFPRNSLDNIVKDPANPTTYITSGGKILSEYMDLQSDVGGASTSSDKAKAPTTSAVQDYVSSSGIIPQSAVNGLDVSLSSKQNVMSAGYRMELVSGTIIDQSRYFEIEPAIIASANATTSVTLSAGKAYEINATASNAKVEFHREEPPMQRAFGLEGHMEIFVANTGYIVAGSDVVLAQPLEPDSVNNCTIRFHDGLAIISVEDNIAGYIVSVSSGTLNGSLPYGITSAGSQYIAFNDTLAGIAIDLSGASANGEKHIVGNGYSDTILKGAVDCGTSKFTVANLSLDDVQVTGGIMTLGDVYIPSGATVSVSGGGLAVEKVTGNGGVIDLGGTNVNVSAGTTASASGCTFSGGSGSNGGAFRLINGGSADFNGCTFSGNTATISGGALVIQNASATLVSCTISGNNATNGGGIGLNGATVYLSSCTISGNGTNATYGKDLWGIAGDGGVCILSGCTLGSATIRDGQHIVLNGNNTVDVIQKYTDTLVGSVTISSGAILDLTGNTNATPINPGGGVTFAPGGATVYPSAGSASAYTLGGMTVPQLGNTNVVNLGGTNLAPSDGGFAKNVRFTSMAAVTAVEAVMDTNISFDGCEFVNPGSATTIAARTRAIINLSDCTLNSCSLKVGNSGAFVFAGSNTFTGKFVDQASGGVIISSGAVLDLTGNTNATPINPGGGVTFAPGGATVYPSAGSASAYTLGGMTVPTIGNTNVVAFASATIINLDSFASNAVIDTGSYVVLVHGISPTFTLKDSTLIGTMYAGNYTGMQPGTIVLDGTCTISGRITDNVGSQYTPSGKCIITSDAIVNLAGNTNATPINPGGGITLYGGVLDNPTKIYGSAGSTTESREFSAECTITGSAVTKIGAIAGATVTIPSSIISCEIEFIKSGETIVSSAYIQANQTPYVLETQQGAGAVLVRVVED